MKLETDEVYGQNIKNIREVRKKSLSPNKYKKGKTIRRDSEIHLNKNLSQNKNGNSSDDQIKFN